jgi:signal transduction histidine kinase
MEEQLTALSAHIERAREDERTGIARAIHDELGQALTGLKMDVAYVEREVVAPAPDVGERLDAMSRLIDQTIDQVRRISAELRPGVLDHLGLVAALEWQAEEFERRTGTRCRARSSLDEIVLARDASTAVFRIFQEALTNVARHAGATRVDVKLEMRGGRLHLEVVDNGKGIRPGAVNSPSSLGLLGIRERARWLGGEVEVKAGKAGGTTVSLTIPLERRAEGPVP